MVKRMYSKPKAIVVDFCYDDQVVASSVCKNYSLISKMQPDDCWEEFKDNPIVRSANPCIYRDKE